MNKPTFTSQSPGNLHCDVCGNIINHAQGMKLKGKDYNVCHAFDCNRLINQRESMSPIMFRSHLKFQRKLLQQRNKRQAEKKQRIEQITALHKQQEHDILQRVLAANTQLDNRIQTVVIPSGLSTVTGLSESRIHDYLQHLQTIIEEAANYDSIEDLIHDQHYEAKHKLASTESRFTDNPRLRNISDRLCTLCKGGCCISGNEHAYLSTFSMRQQMERNPLKTRDELFEQYRRFISTDTIEGSCINHRPDGCALPRELRSNICNAFYCDSLKTFQSTNQQSQPEDLLVFQRADTHSTWINPDVDNDITRLALMQHDSINEVNCESGEMHEVKE